MSWAAAAAIGGTIVAGSIQAEGAEDAANAQGQSTGAAVAENRRQFDTSRKDLAPYRSAGTAALTRIRDLLGLGKTPIGEWQYGEATPEGAMGLTEWASQNHYDLPQGRDWMESETANLLPGYRRYLGGLPQQPQAAAPAGATVMEMDPGYQFRLNEGNKGLDRRIGAMGLRNSGAALKAATRFGQDYASNEFGNVFNRLSGLAGTGQAATNTGAALGAQNAQTVGGLMTGLGNARGASAIAGSNALGGAFGTVGNYYGQQSTLDRILGARNTGGRQSNADIASMYNF
jgi:hypothetical protein